jgi:hypothetical protein
VDFKGKIIIKTTKKIEGLSPACCTEAPTEGGFDCCKILFVWGLGGRPSSNLCVKIAGYMVFTCPKGGYVKDPPS